MVAHHQVPVCRQARKLSSQGLDHQPLHRLSGHLGQFDAHLQI